MRRLLEIAAGLGLAWLAAQAKVLADPRPSAPPAPPAVDTALPEHADTIASYTLRASLDPDRHVVTGTGTIRWKNASRAAAHELWLHLYLNAFKSERTLMMRFPSGDFRGGTTLGARGFIEVQKLALDGEDLWPRADRTSPGDPEDETDIRVPLPRPVDPGQEITLDVAFASHLPALLFRTGHVDRFEMVAQWFPKIARLEPDGRWAHFAFHRLSEFYADFGAYDVTIDTPASFVVGATGHLEAEMAHGARVERRFVQRDVHDFAFTAWDRFQELTALTEDGVELRVLFPPGHDADAAVELEATRFGLRHFGRAFGRYPYPTLTIVHPPPGAEEAGGMEYPTLITTGGPWFLPWTGARIIENVTIHELGHQWFYGLVATDEHGWPFLDEGINSWAEGDALEAAYPGASAASTLGLAIGVPAYQRIASVDAARNAVIAQPASAFASGADYGALVYHRTATLLRTLGNVYGEGRVRDAVGLYARRHRFQHPGPDDLERAVREVVGDDAATQLHAALFDRATVDYAVGSFESELDRTAHGLAGDPSGKAQPADTYRGSVLVRRRGELRFPVDVDLVRADGKIDRVRWDAKEPAERLPWRGTSPLVAAVIDPEHRVLLDEDLSNNARRRKRHGLSGALTDRISFGASALLSAVLP